MTLSAQDMDQSLKTDLKFYGDIMYSAENPVHRARAAQVFNQMVDDYVSEQSAYNCDLSFIDQVTAITPQDSSFTIYTWQVELKDKNYDYFGYIFHQDKPYEKLVSQSILDKSMQYETHDAGDWYGALYYNILNIADGEYLIFGFNANGEFNNAKVADILTFENDKALLGKEIFQDAEDTLTYKSKLVISYSEDASVNLNFNPSMDMIVLDHLMQRIGRLPGQGPTYLPDGTYEGYAYNDGKWMYKRKLFNHSYGKDNAPRPKPVLNTQRKLKSKR
jgi:hypothetical protein